MVQAYVTGVTEKTHPVATHIYDNIIERATTDGLSLIYDLYQHFAPITLPARSSYHSLCHQQKGMVRGLSATVPRIRGRIIVCKGHTLAGLALLTMYYNNTLRRYRKTNENSDGL